MGILLWVERKIKNYYGKQAKKIFKKMRNSSCFWAGEGLVHPDWGAAMSENDWVQKLTLKGRLALQVPNEAKFTVFGAGVCSRIAMKV